MKIYLVGGGHKPWIKDSFFDFYMLHSYEYLKKEKKEIDLIDKYKDFILDSGVFTYLNGGHGKNIDWEEYANEYSNFIIKYKIKKYIEVDIDKEIGLENVEKLRKKIEKKVGYKSIPVWHVGRGYDKWLEICNDYKYVAIGGFVNKEIKKTDYKKIYRFLIEAKKKKCKVHGLGFTSISWLKKFFFYSVDSSSWTIGNRAGYLFKFIHEGKNTKIKQIKKPEGTKISSHLNLASCNFYEWVKFSKYAEKCL